MKKISTLFCAGVLISTLCAGCNEPYDPESGLGEEIPGMEIKKATGTIIGSYVNGFGSLLMQVDEEYPIGKPVTYVGNMTYLTLPEDGTYHNTIQVQWKLPFKGGERISFSFREFREKEDVELFTNSLITKMDGTAPKTPIYVITEYKILNN